MASFRATLEFAGKEYDVLHSEYEFSRTTDAKGKPSSNIQGGRVSVVIESTDDTATIEAMLMDEYMGYVDEAMKLRDELAAATGYDKISQEAHRQCVRLLPIVPV